MNDLRGEGVRSRSIVRVREEVRLSQFTKEVNIIDGLM